MKTFKTQKGSELPLLNLKGKDYLQVQHRIVWFREELPKWSIETELLERTETASTAKATIKDEAGRIMATAHKRETKQGFADHIEKAETGSIGRALALIGYGTQFTDDLDEGSRLADSPTLKVAPNPTEATKEWSDKYMPSMCPSCGAEGRPSKYDEGKFYCSDYKNGCKAKW
jgi:hypothetical protein